MPRTRAAAGRWPRCPAGGRPAPASRRATSAPPARARRQRRVVVRDVLVVLVLLVRRGAPGVVGIGPRIVAQGDPDGEQGRDHGDEVGEVPGAADGGRPPPDRAGREQDRRQRPDHQPDPEAAEHPPRGPDADRGQGDGDRLLVDGQAQQGDERQQHERGQGRERQQDLARRLSRGVEQRIDVLEVPVRRTVRAVGDRPVERNLPVQECVRLPDEMVVLVVVLGVGPRVQRERRQRQQQPDDDGREATGAGLGRQYGPVRGLGYTPLHLQRCVRGSP